jgi:hypothetical protein
MQIVQYIFLLFWQCCSSSLLCTVRNNYHLFAETEGNSVFCGPKTAVVARGEAEGNNGSQGATKHCFPEVSVNKCFVMYCKCQSMNNSPVIGVNLI